MAGLITIAGGSGAGKTTLVRGALKVHSGALEYLTTYTTREPRDGDLGYRYVSHDEYADLMAASPDWDHTPIHANSYGADVADAKRRLAGGLALIVTTMPDAPEIQKMAGTYNVDPLTMYVKTPRELRLERLLARVTVETAGIEDVAKVEAARGKALARLEIEDTLIPRFEEYAAAKPGRVHVFEPVHDLSQDTAHFNEIIGEYING